MNIHTIYQTGDKEWSVGYYILEPDEYGRPRQTWVLITRRYSFQGAAELVNFLNGASKDYPTSP